MAPVQRVNSQSTARPLTEHDLEHRNLRLQVFVLRQLVLRQYVAEFGERAGEVITERLAAMREYANEGTLHPAEQALLMDESAEVFGDVDEHVALVQAGAL